VLCNTSVTPTGRGFTAKLSQEDIMLWTIFVLLMILWVLGMVTAHTMVGFIHLLLLLAIVTVLVRVIQGRRPV
jgi:hypothetical protein